MDFGFMEAYVNNPLMLILLGAVVAFVAFVWKVLPVKIEKMEERRQETKKQEEAQKQFESGSINKLLDDQIAMYDHELTDYAVDRADDLKGALDIKLKHVYCQSTRRSLASCLGSPLWKVCQKNNFKEELKPEKIKAYTVKILKKMTKEYQRCCIEKEIAMCSVDNKVKCLEIPPLDELITMLQKELIEEWALPIRQKNIEICGKKIKLYQEQIPLYEALNDIVRVNVAKFCIEKNERYIAELSRSPGPGEI